MDLNDLRIDPEFEEKIPPLTEDEFLLLEQNIVADGEVLDPLIIWNDTILDGHNRYRILKKHPEIPFKTYPKDFSDKYAAIAWICNNQLGRRNLTPYSASLHTGYGTVPLQLGARSPEGAQRSPGRKRSITREWSAA